MVFLPFLGKMVLYSTSATTPATTPPLPTCCWYLRGRRYRYYGASSYSLHAHRSRRASSISSPHSHSPLSHNLNRPDKGFQVQPFVVWVDQNFLESPVHHREESLLLSSFLPRVYGRARSVASTSGHMLRLRLLNSERESSEESRGENG